MKWHNQHEHHAHDDPKLLRRISCISVINGVIGAAELASGFLTGSSTLTMAGVHDVTDGGLYATKRRAAGEQNPARKRALRRKGAVALMGAALAFGTYQVVSDVIEEDHQPEVAAAYVGLLAAGTNVAAAGLLHSRQHHTDAQDTWRHVMEVDLPGSVVTLIFTPLSVKYPGLDIVGTGLHMALATRLGVQMLHSTNESC